MEKRIQLMKPWIEEGEYEAVKKVLESGYLTEGPVTREFEEEFAKYIGVKYAVATTSCTTALELGLRALGVGKGDEVIVSDFTYPATADVVYLLGAEPVLVDVSPESYNIEPDEIKKAITGRTKAIIPVSEFGNPLDLEVYRIGREHGIPIVEDAACSAGAEINGKKVGTFADITCFSFHPRKVITTGEGGMLVTDNEEIAERAESFKHFGVEATGKERHRSRFANLGTNYKLSNVLSAIGLVQLKKIDKIISERIKKARTYDKLLENLESVKTPIVKENCRHTFQSYCVKILREGIRDELIENLKNKGIETQIGTYSLHMEPFFAKTKRVGKLSNSEYLYKNLLALPLHHELSFEEQEYVCKTIKDLMKTWS